MRIHLLAAALVLTLASRVHAQPIIHQGDGRVLAEVPVEVQIRPGGAYTVSTSTVGPFLAAELDSHLPRRVPLVTIDEQGIRTPGFFAENPTSEVAASIMASHPDRIEFDPATGYMIRWMTASCSRGGRVGFAPGDRVRIDAWSSVPVRYTARRDNAVTFHPRDNPFNIIWGAVNGVPPGRGLQVDQVLLNVKSRLEQILGNGRGNVTINVSFVNTLPAATPAQTTTNTAPVTYPNMRGFLAQQAFLDGFVFDEDADLTSYESLPGGATFPAYMNYPLGPSGLGYIRLPAPLWEQLFVPDRPTGPDATIELNANLAWDFTDADGIDGNKYDLEYTITHEAIHALGFETRIQSVVPPTDPNSTQLNNACSILDMFRFSRSGFPGGVPAAAFASVPRMLTAGVNAATATVTSNPPLTFDMSTGLNGGSVTTADGFQAQHWQQAGIFGSYIGLMDPLQLPGDTARAFGYVFASDAHALDAVGWVVEFPLAPFAPPPCVPTSPALGDLNVPLAPIFQWTPGSGTGSINLVIYRGVAASEQVRVFFQSELPGDATSFGLPAGVLSRGKIYSWRLVSFTGTEFSQSPLVSFTTTGCAADFNGMDGLSAQDIFDFLGAWFNSCMAQGPGCTDTADFNGDGMLSVDDIFAFLNAWFAGC